MGHGADGLLAALAGDQALVLPAPGAIRAPGGVGRLAQEIADRVIVLAGLAGFALAGGFVIARTQGRPRRELCGLAESGQVGADFHQDQGGGDVIEARQGLQELPVVGLGRHGVDQVTVQLRQFGVEGVDMALNVSQHETVTGRKFSVEGLFQKFVCCRRFQARRVSWSRSVSVSVNVLMP